MLDHLIRIARLLSAEMRRRSELRDMLERDDAFFEDVGVTRADVQVAMRRPMDLDLLRRRNGDHAMRSGATGRWPRTPAARASGQPAC